MRWLGDVPAHWNVLNRALFVEMNERDIINEQLYQSRSR